MPDKDTKKDKLTHRPDQHEDNENSSLQQVVETISSLP
jgi:hypothetical protein